MSFQPTAPMPVQAVPPPPTGSGSRSKLLRLLGLLAIIGGVGAAILMFILAGSATEKAVEKFARAPVNCTTTLDFSSTGEYIFFIESRGASADIGGDCDANDENYDGDDNPDVDIVLLDGDDEIDLDRADDLSYDTDTFTGEAFRVAEIDDTGSYRLRVESEDDEFAIAVGRDPTSQASTLRAGAIAAGLGGLVIGGVLLLLGRTKKPAVVPPAPSFGQPQFGAPTFEPRYSAQGGPPQGAPGAVPPVAPQSPGWGSPVGPPPTAPTQNIPMEPGFAQPGPVQPGPAQAVPGFGSPGANPPTPASPTPADWQAPAPPMQGTPAAPPAWQPARDFEEE
jgi:hypothetical protein